MSLAKAGQTHRPKEKIAPTLRYLDVIAWRNQEHVEWQVDAIYTFTDEVELSMLNGKAKKISRLSQLEACAKDGRITIVARGPKEDHRWLQLSPRETNSPSES